MTDKPVKVAVIIPVFNTPVEFLREAVDSITSQLINRDLYSLNIFVHDDGSSLPETISYLDECNKNGIMYVSDMHLSSNSSKKGTNRRFFVLVPEL